MIWHSTTCRGPRIGRGSQEGKHALFVCVKWYKLHHTGSHIRLSAREGKHALSICSNSLTLHMAWEESKLPTSPTKFPLKEVNKFCPPVVFGLTLPVFLSMAVLLVWLYVNVTWSAFGTFLTLERPRRQGWGSFGPSPPPQLPRFSFSTCSPIMNVVFDIDWMTLSLLHLCKINYAN